MPASGTLNSGGSAVNWVGTAVGGGSTDESTCVEGVNCDTFVITLSGTPSNWSGLKARVVISCADPSGTSDYDVYVHKGDNTGPVVGESAHGGTPPEVVDLDPSDPDIGTGQFSVHVVYFSAFAGFQYSGSASPVSASAGTALAPSAPLDKGPKIGFQNFEAPGSLMQVKDSSQGRPCTPLNTWVTMLVNHQLELTGTHQTQRQG